MICQRHPLMLPCQHTFCLECLARSCIYEFQTNIGWFSKSEICLISEINEETFTDCPLCRSNATFPAGVITNFPSHQIILKLMSLVGKGDQKLERAKVEEILERTHQETG